MRGRAVEPHRMAAEPPARARVEQREPVVRFHLDEHMDPDIALALRRYGIDITTTVESGLRTRDDDKQLEFIRSERRVIVTDDTDFLRLAAFRRFVSPPCDA
jgi:predicted nuclease of predicted toxin-antitoxin system